MNKIDLYPGQRKTCRAVATIVKGNGKIRINNIPAEVIQPETCKGADFDTCSHNW